MLPAACSRSLWRTRGERGPRGVGSSGRLQRRRSFHSCQGRVGSKSPIDRIVRAFAETHPLAAPRKWSVLSYLQESWPFLLECSAGVYTLNIQKVTCPLPSQIAFQTMHLFLYILPDVSRVETSMSTFYDIYFLCCDHWLLRSTLQEF